MPSGLFYLNFFDRSISSKGGVWKVSIITMVYRNSCYVPNANNVDPDQMPRSVSSDQDLHCLLMAHCFETPGINGLMARFEAYKPGFVLFSMECCFMQPNHSDFVWSYCTGFVMRNDLNLRCLSMSLLWDTRHKWVKEETFWFEHIYFFPKYYIRVKHSTSLLKRGQLKKKKKKRISSLGKNILS